MASVLGQLRKWPGNPVPGSLWQEGKAFGIQVLLQAPEKGRVSDLEAQLSEDELLRLGLEK